MVPLFGAAYAAPNKGTTILYLVESRILMCKSVFFISFQSLKTVGRSLIRPLEVLEKSLNFTQTCLYEPWCIILFQLKPY